MRARIGLLLVAALLLPLGALAQAPAAGATAASLSVDTLDPAVLTPGGQLRVAGQLGNTGRQELRDVEVRLRLSSTRLGSRAELAAVAAGETTSRDGEVVLSRSLPDLGAGAVERFDLTVAADDLEALTAFGVYVLGVEVLASRSAGFGRVALVRTMLPWVPGDERLVPTGVTWLWPLVGRPARLADGSFTDDSLASDIGPDGRLSRLLTTGAALSPGAAVTWVVDPELIAAVTDMADGYRVRAADGRLVPGGASGLAVRWLEQLRAATAGAPVIPLAYGDVDVTGLTRAGLEVDVNRAFTLGRATVTEALPGAEVLADTAWPEGGYASRAALAALRRTGAGSVVLDGRAVPPAIDLSYTPSGRAHVPTREGRLDGLLAEPGLADLLATRGDAPLIDAQRFVAETAMIAAELPSGPGRSVLVMPPRRWDPDPAYLDRVVGATSGAPWVRAVPLRELAAAPPPEVDRAAVVYPRVQRLAELPRSYLTALRAMRESSAVFAEILTDRTAYLPELERSTLLLASGWWRTRPVRVNRLARERGYLADLRAQVSISPASYTFSSRRGTIALTVANGLEQPVTVALRLVPQTPRLQLAATRTQRIGPGQKVQLGVEATAVAAGPVVVDASLRTPAGSAYGQPVQLRISITEYGTVALYITIGAAAVLFLAAGVRVLRRVLTR